MRIDLNADVGEAPPGEARAAELDVLASVTSVNVACGGHAGDPDSMQAFVDAAKVAGLAVGAHPGYADREGLGRRAQSLSRPEIVALVRDQVSRLADVAGSRSIRLSHVKPHGALYNQAATERAIADAIAESVRECDPALRLVGLAGSQLVAAGRAAGLSVAAEAFADRAYRPDGTLVPRTEPGAVHHDSDAVVKQALSIAVRRRVQLPDGRTVPVEADTICLHGDTPGAAELARRVRAALVEAGVTVARLDRA